MKIIEVCTSESLGGLELYFASCCQQLSDRGNDVRAIVFEGSRLHKMIKQETDCITVRKPTLQSFFHLQKVLAKVKPDIVHVHHKKDLLAIACLRRFSGLDFKYVHTRQMDQPRNKKNPYHSFIYRSMDVIIAITDRLKNQIVSKINVDPNRVIRLYYGVPSPERHIKRCSEIAIQSNDFNVGVVARIDSKKDQHIIVEATKLLLADNKKVRTYLIGGTTNEEYLNKIKHLISKYGLKKNVIITGFVEKPQELMPCFDLVVLTTSNETFGLVLPEAMRMGIPVIGAKGGGVPEIIDHEVNGLVFEPGNSKDLKIQIAKLMDKEKRIKLAIEGKKKADIMFDIDQHFDKLQHVFKTHPI